MEHQISIELLGIRIDEPMAMITDILISIVCFHAFYQLHNRKLSGRSQLYFRYYFLLMGIATFLGGVIGHGFLYALSFGWKLPGWITSMISVALIERSSIAHAKPLIKSRTGNFFLIINLIELLVIITITMVTLNFKWVEFHSAYGLLVIVSSFHLYTYYKTKDRGSLTILIAVTVTCIASLIFINKISIHRWLNYIDISHLLLAIAAYIFYRGSLLLQKRDGKNPVRSSNHIQKENHFLMKPFYARFAKISQPDEGNSRQ
jgi:hypothetical protein